MMLVPLFGRRPDDDVRNLFAVTPHHPDRLRRPGASTVTPGAERFAQALTWNIFRTLELIAPAFWLRRLHARLTGGPFPPAPQVAQVSLWRRLPLPPIELIDGARPDVLADVLIETEAAVWTLIVADDREPWKDEHRVADVVDAGTWLAGVREYYAGVIETSTTPTSLGSVLKERYSRSRESVMLRSSSRGPARASMIALGSLQWQDLSAILRECRDAHNLTDIERAIARHALVWLQNAGISQ
jgi:hypothetical protein